MPVLPLRFRERHLYLELDGDLWLFDTGSPTSFGEAPSVTVAGNRVSLARACLGMDAGGLTRATGVPCRGLLGLDALAPFDWILDVPAGTATADAGALSLDGATLPLDDLFGVPIVQARIRDRDCRMFFDTGAQVSYLQDDALRTSFPPAGRFRDFRPTGGALETETHAVDVSLGGVGFTVRCGVLDGLLGQTMELAGAVGVIGNEVMASRPVGWFPRRGEMVV